jgi:uncharacterized protein
LEKFFQVESSVRTNKRKIINDPVYGFINIPGELAFDLIEHPFFQRLRRIRQLGLTNFVYPGANHTRFQHALGTVYLMSMAIEVLRSKDNQISEEEAEAVTIAILLHDIGHGPFSHSLERTLIEDISHEDLSMLIMQELNDEFDDKLSLAISIFQNKYHKEFLYQLVSSQLDMDRLDYLNRDSFFTGVAEGVIGSERIIKMLNVANDQLVVEAKGIYSVEKFLVARRLMHWQVYLHKTVIAADQLLLQILRRAKFLASENVELFATPALSFFLYNHITKYSLNRINVDNNLSKILQFFNQLDDYDIIASIKVWASHKDTVLSTLAGNFINRHLPKIELSPLPFEESKIKNIYAAVCNSRNLSHDEASYLITNDFITNNAYNFQDERIKILYNNGQMLDITEASDMLNISVLSKVVKKYYLCYPKNLVFN